MTFALAGDGVGSAAWLEFTDQNTANAVALQHGNAVLLSSSQWTTFKAAYLSPAPVV